MYLLPRTSLTHLLVFGAKLVESVYVTSVERLHHAPKPRVRAIVQHAQDGRRQLLGPHEKGDRSGSGGGREGGSPVSTNNVHLNATDVSLASFRAGSGKFKSCNFATHINSSDSFYGGEGGLSTTAKSFVQRRGQNVNDKKKQGTDTSCTVDNSSTGGQQQWGKYAR